MEVLKESELHLQQVEEMEEAVEEVDVIMDLGAVLAHLVKEIMVVLRPVVHIGVDLVEEVLVQLEVMEVVVRLQVKLVE
jgi:hypothetical protein